MLIKEQNRSINGASAHDFAIIEDGEWPEPIKTINYVACPNEQKNFIESTNLEDLVYWKLNKMLDNKNQADLSGILKDIIADVERPLFTLILAKTNGNQSKAAELLGCNRNTLHRKLKDFLIDPKIIKKSSEKSSYRKSPSTKENAVIYL